MSDINPTAPTPPDGPKHHDQGNVGKNPKGFGKDSPIGAGGERFGSDSNWFNHFNKKQKEQFLSNLSQMISAQMKQEEQREAKAARKLKASEEGKDPSDVQ